MPVNQQRTYRRATRMESAGGRGALQRIWEAVRLHRDDFTPFLIHSSSEASGGAIRSYLHSLRAGGFIERINQRAKTADEQHYRLIRDCGIEYPRLTAKGTPITRDLCTEAIWRTMRIIGEFSIKELVAFAATPDRPIAAITVTNYLRHLVQAGYVQQVSKSKYNGRYRLIASKYTGPKPPVVGRSAYVYDPNLDSVVWEESVNHADL